MSEAIEGAERVEIKRVRNGFIVMVDAYPSRHETGPHQILVTESVARLNAIIDQIGWRVFGDE